MFKWSQILLIFVLSVFSVVVLCVVAGLAWLVWVLHPWVPPGRAIPLGAWKFDDCQFEVWQPKTMSITEPFTTELFVKSGTNAWLDFCLDVDDIYRGSIDLTRSGADIIVSRRGKKRATFDLKEKNLRSWPGSEVFTPAGIGDAGKPPSQRW